MIRLVPTVVGAATFSLLAVLYAFDAPAYLAVLQLAGIKPWRQPFIDSGFMYAMKQCWLHGVDIYQSVPCDIIPGNKMAYSPLWQRLPLLPSSDSARLPIGIISDLLLLLSVAFLPPARRVRDAILLSLAITSTMVCFALERNNIDVWIYLLIFAGVQLWLRGHLFRALGYGIFLLAGLLKYYPMVLFGLALQERPRRFFLLAVTATAALALFIGTFRAELAEELPNIPIGSPFGDLVGIVNIPIVVRGLVAPLAPGGQAGKLAGLVCRLAMTVGVIAWSAKLAHRPGLRQAVAGMDRAEATWLMSGCLVMGGCYLIGQNVGYRGIYLLLVMSGLLALLRGATDAAIFRSLWRTVILLVPLMWMEAIRFWVDHGARVLHLPRDLRHALQALAWLSRELLWFDLEHVMLAVLIVFAMQSRMWRVLQRPGALAPNPIEADPAGGRASRPPSVRPALAFLPPTL